ncbi:MAG: imidazole glycerol phosphate synthase subunit HisH [Thermoanaerobaculia bacterium]
MISVVSYGVANIGSMLNMLRKIGVAAQPVSKPEEVARAEKLILPGVGAFDNGITALRDLGLAEPLRARVAQGFPILGVCLGMQMLSYGSEEGALPGLGLVAGRCVRFRPGGAVRIPHMGWSEPHFLQTDGLAAGLDRARFYFVHSYHFVCDDPDDRLAVSQYGGEFTAAVHRDNIWGVQFHPEKSHRFGMALLRNFAGL